MSNRPVLIAVAIATVSSSLLAGAATWMVVQPASCSMSLQKPSAEEANQQKVRDFFKSSAPPITGGQQMRPRW